MITIADQFKDNKLLVDQNVRMGVEMAPSSMMVRLAATILSELQRIVPYVGYAPVSNLECNDILKYLCTLIWMRVQYVSGGDKAFSTYRTYYQRLAVPVVMSQLLMSMGEAIDRDFGLTFIPTYSIEAEKLLPPDEMLALSDIFMSLESHGLKLVYGLPKDVNGELDFMALSSVEGVVRSYHRGHPVYGFLAAFFEQQQLNAITGNMCRVIYGYRSDYEAYLREFLQRTVSAH